jgi:hypothetical protein
VRSDQSSIGFLVDHCKNKKNKTPAQAFTLTSRLVKYHRNTLKNNLKHVDVLHFLTAVTSRSQTFRELHNKNHTKPIEFSDISKNTEKFKRMRNETITASKICNVIKGRTIIFWRGGGGGGDISSTQTIFFGVVVVANNFFAPASFCKQFIFVHRLIAVDFILN